MTASVAGGLSRGAALSGGLAFLAAGQHGIQLGWVVIGAQFFADTRVAQRARDEGQRLQVFDTGIARRFWAFCNSSMPI